MKKLLIGLFVFLFVFLGLSTNVFAVLNPNLPSFTSITTNPSWSSLDLRFSVYSPTTVTEVGYCLKKVSDTTSCTRNIMRGLSSYSDARIILASLEPTTNYTYYLYAKNSYGEGKSGDINFTTLAVAPEAYDFVTPSYMSPRVEIYPAPTGVTSSTADVGGYLTSLGTLGISERGACYGSSTSSITNCSVAYLVQGPNDMFATKFTGLNPNTTYYYRVYAKNSSETVYSSNGSFKTLSGVASTTLPSVSNLSATNITQNSATISMNVMSLGNPAATISNICSDTSTGQTNCSTVGAKLGIISRDLTGLIPNTTYYFSGSVSGTGTSSGGVNTGVKSFTTSPVITSTSPVMSNLMATNITQNSATISMNVTSLGNPAAYSGGMCFDTSSTGKTNCSTLGISLGVNSRNLTGLTPNTTYYFVGQAVNSSGTFYSEVSSFKTLSTTTPTSVEVYYPKAGDRYVPGQSITIKWTPGTPGISYVTFYKSGSYYSTTARVTTSPDTSGSMSYTFPTDMPVGEYKIMAFNGIPQDGYSNSNKVFESNGTFSIVSATGNNSPVKINWPNGGETLNLGSLSKITWTGGKNKVKIGLLMTTSSSINLSDSLIGWIEVNGLSNSYVIWDGKTLKDLNGDFLKTITPGNYRIVAVSQGETGNYCMGGDLATDTVSLNCNYDVSDLPFTISSDPGVKDSENVISSENNLLYSNVRISRTLRQGTRGEDVKVLQEFLEIKADGIFGRGTALKVKEWQAANGLKSDGLFGKMSRHMAGLD